MEYFRCELINFDPPNLDIFKIVGCAKVSRQYRFANWATSEDRFGNIGVGI